MSATSSAPETPAEETASSAMEEESGAAESAGPSGKNKRRNAKKQEKKAARKNKKGEKNSPRPPSGEKVKDANNPTVQDPKPVVPAPVAIPSGEGDGELVEKGEGSGGDGDGDGELIEKVDSGGEDSAVIVEMPQADSEKAADETGSAAGSAAGSDEWAEFVEDAN
jgi:hypothetical protein